MRAVERGGCCRVCRCRRQGGSVAIEFAILFPLFLLILYAIVSYSIVFVAQQGLHSLSADAVREAVRVERSGGELDATAIQSVVTGYVGGQAHWPASLASLCSDGITVDGASNRVDVCVEIGVGVGEALALPTLDLLGIKIPALENDRIVSTSSIRL